MRARTPEQVEDCVRAWIDKKFHAPDKIELRDKLWPSVSWSFHLVHATVRYEDELKVFEREGVVCHPFHQLLSDLSQRDGRSFSGSAGGDLAEIVSYYKSYETKELR